MMYSTACTSVLVILLIIPASVYSKIDRYAVVSRYNPFRNVSSLSTPMQVGNGNFAFGSDITGLQTFLPFATMASWGWKNDSFPSGYGLEDILSFQGTSLDNHGHNVTYMFGGPEDKASIQQWLVSNPNRVNLGRVGLLFLSSEGALLNVTEEQLTRRVQSLDLWTGILTSEFEYNNTQVKVTTICSQGTDVVGIDVQSSLIRSGQLGLFLDFPWSDGSSKFSAPFVGTFNTPQMHTTALSNIHVANGAQAEISHTLVNNTFITTIGDSNFTITRDNPLAHRYILTPQKGTGSISTSIAFSLESLGRIPNYWAVLESSINGWADFWQNGGFIDVYTGSSDKRADELQRRIVLSQYLLRVNEAGDYPPQESGLVNNGWYGKFHMEMYYWHTIHWSLWSRDALLSRSSSVYSRFLPTAIERSQIQQGWSTGARWSKMTDPTGRSAPGEINELLVWQQPHPLVLAEYEYRALPSKRTLQKWKYVVNETANWMSIFAYHNISTGVYDLGPPMYIVSEDSNPIITRNPALELAYWKLGLQLAESWFRRLGEEVPVTWSKVRDNLAPLPITNGTYDVYEGIPADFWTSGVFTNDHPALVGLNGWLPPTPGLDMSIAKSTMEKVWRNWNISNLWGWDFGMLAMSAARSSEPDKAIDWLLHERFVFDDVGMPEGGTRVPTPYFPGSGSLLLAVAMMAEGWDGSKIPAPGFPTQGWFVQSEGIRKAL